MFQFPSSGKVYSKETKSVIKARGTPGCFNSLRAGKSIQRFRSSLSGYQGARCFNSLRAGKSIQRKSPFRRYDWERDILVFQFPSSGKVYSKKIMRMKIIDGTLYQFQFPSSGKVYSKLYTKIARDWIKAKRFNSLRAGKSIQSTRRRIEKDLMWWRVSIPFERESLFKVP